MNLGVLNLGYSKRLLLQRAAEQGAWAATRHSPQPGAALLVLIRSAAAVQMGIT
jgi:hypothetical protein